MKKTLCLVAACCWMSGCAWWPGWNRLQFSGTLEMTEYSLGSPVPGRLESVAVKEGDPVKAGQLLATLDRRAQAQKDFERVRDLRREGGASDQDLERAELTFKDQAVVSPVDGVVLVKAHEEGEVVGAGSPVVVVGSSGEYWVKIFVPEGAVSRIRLGTPAEITIDGLKQKYPARVSYISPQAEFTPRNVQTAEERVTVTFAVKVALENPPKDLRPGVFADVRLKPE